MQDKLIGYLLGALENDEVTHVEQLLQTSPEARKQLEALRLSIAMLEADRQHVQTPTELVTRTCQRIRQLRNPPQV